MRFRELMESYEPNKHDLEYLRELVEEEMEDVNSNSIYYDYKGGNEAKQKKLARDYQALSVIESVIVNHLKALEKPELLSNNIFTYDYDPEDPLNGIAAAHTKLIDDLARIEWIGSYGGKGSKVYQEALAEAKRRGAKRVEVEAKWDSAGFYHKMGLQQGDSDEGSIGAILRDSPLTKFSGDL